MSSTKLKKKKKNCKDCYILMGISACSVGPPLGGLAVQEHSLCCTPPQKTQNIWHHMAPVFKTESFQHNDAHNYK